MKKYTFFAIFALAIFIIISCSSPVGSDVSVDTDGIEFNEKIYSNSKGGKTYTLTISHPVAKAAVGDGYTLKVAKNGIVKISSGKIETVNGTNLVYQPNQEGAPNFTVGFNGSRLTFITGTITFDDATDEPGPGSFLTGGGGGGGGGSSSGGGSSGGSGNGGDGGGSGGDGGGGGSGGGIEPVPTITSVIIPQPAPVTRGGSQLFTATVNGTNNPEQTVTWSVTGNKASGTSISINGGLLTVDASEPATTLTIKAVSTFDTTKSGTATVTVNGDINVITPALVISASTVSVLKDSLLVLGINIANLTAINEQHKAIGGNIQCEWYSNNSNSTQGGTRVGEGFSFTTPTTSTGTFYYYVIVTNTINDGSGTKKIIVSIGPVKVTVTDNKLVSIKVKQIPDRVYKMGEEISKDDLVVENVYSNGSTEPTNDYDIKGDFFTAGSSKITIVSRIDTSKTATFNIIISNELINTGLPALRIDTAGKLINSTEIWVLGATFTFYNILGTELSSGSMDIKGRGNTTWNDHPKKPYSLKFTNSISLQGMPSHRRWNLLANHADKTLLRTEVAFRLGGIFNNLAWTPRSEQVDVYLNDKYCGVYQLTEAIKIDVNRVNINKIGPSTPDGGYILEIDVRKGEEFNFTTTRNVVFCCSDPDEGFNEIISGENKTLLKKIQEDVQSAEDALYSDDFTNTITGYRKYLDVDSFIDWYLVNEITKNVDAVFWSSVYMYYDPLKRKYCLGPIWDFDISQGNNKYSDMSNPNNFYIKNSKWISRLFDDPAFDAQVKSRWNEKKTEVDGILQFIDNRALSISNAVYYNFRRWPILDQYVEPNAVVTGSYSGEINYLKEYLTSRISWLDKAINNL